MECLEIIELRTGDVDSKNLVNTLSRFLNDLNKENEKYSFRLYRHLTVETDWSFHVHYQSRNHITSPSPVGLRIASVLQEFGLVHHSVWSEEKQRKKTSVNNY